MKVTVDMENLGNMVQDVLEKNLNLSIAMKLKYLFELTDIDVVMTRMDDILLYKEGQESRKKFYDVRNRVEVIEQYDNPIFISIHQNKFPIEKFLILLCFSLFDILVSVFEFISLLPIII